MSTTTNDDTPTCAESDSSSNQSSTTPVAPAPTPAPVVKAKDAPLPPSLPFSHDAEQGLLSCFLHDPVALLADAQASLPAPAFYHAANRLLYEIMLEFHGDNRPVEYIALSQYLQDAKLMDRLGGHGQLAELLDFVPTPAHYGYYKGIVLDKYLQRRLIGVCQEAVDAAFGCTQDVRSLLGAVADRVSDLCKQEQGVGRRSFAEIMERFVETWEGKATGRIEAGIPTRWRSFNETFGGITPGLWVIAGYPSDGKSTLAQNLVEDALAHGRQVLWYSYEMDEEEMANRLVAARTRLDSRKLFFPQSGVAPADRARISRAVGEMQSWGLHLRCEPTWTVEQICAETRALALRQPLGLVAVDYLQLVPTHDAYDTRAQQVASISHALKRLSLSLGLPVVLLSQLNDEGKTLDSRAPTQDARNVLGIEPGGTEIIKGREVHHPAGLRVEKNRHGKRGHLLPIALRGERFTFEEERERGDAEEGSRA